MSLDINYVHEQPFIGIGKVITPVITISEHITTIDRNKQIIVWNPEFKKYHDNIKKHLVR